ncbi:MAG: SDR family oxidoreductase [Chloroflexota bacterium]|nr:SDR family oxidoreductase [Chloroflexota bacterium]
MSILDRFSLAGRTALVTGSGQGIGRAFALALAEAGADVAIVDINPDTAHAVAQEIQDIGVRSMALEVDVTQKDQVQEMMRQIVDIWGKLDIGVNNAGIGRWADAEAMSEEDWDAVVNVNLKGVFLCCQAEGQVMLKQGYGKIINTASMSAHIVNRPQNQVAYNASKAGVVHLTKSMAAEWAPRGVRVNCISPGYTRTALVDEVGHLIPGWLEDIPMGRMAETSDLQGALIYLASEASDYVTGHDLVVDGGFTLW